jgi:adenine deaminase
VSLAPKARKLNSTRARTRDACFVLEGVLDFELEDRHVRLDLPDLDAAALQKDGDDAYARVMRTLQIPRKQLSRRIQAAQGKIPCDVVLKNARYLDVFAGQWRTGDIGMIDGTIVSLENRSDAARVIDLKGRAVVPGFIDAHVHVESSMITPGRFQQAVLSRGTTSAVCDPHELANVLGVDGIRYFLDSSIQLDLDLWVMLSSCVPATHLETNGGGKIKAAALQALQSHPKALGLAEMMNVPGVLFENEEVIEKLEAFTGMPIDGHAPLLKGASLSAYAAAGISSCHESSELEEAREKLTRGIAVWIREGSVAKDLQTLAPLLDIASSAALGFCTDDRNPYDIAAEGHIDYLIREAIRTGVAPEAAYRASSWSVARHYGLDTGMIRYGAIAPGYQADLVVLDDMKTCAVSSVWKSGKLASELSTPSIKDTQSRMNTIRTKAPELSDLEGPSGRVNVIGVIPGKIVTEKLVANSTDEGVARLAVLERYGHGSKPAVGYVRGFGSQFTGAIASSVGHDSHNLIAVGKETRDMKVAMNALIEIGGGFAVVRDGLVVSKLELPLGGLMSDLEAPTVAARLKDLKAASRSVGCELDEPFLQLAFLSLPVIPALKLTDKGLVDVDRFEIIPVRA